MVNSVEMVVAIMKEMIMVAIEIMKEMVSGVMEGAYPILAATKVMMVVTMDSVQMSLVPAEEPVDQAVEVVLVTTTCLR